MFALKGSGRELEPPLLLLALAVENAPGYLVRAV